MQGSALRLRISAAPRVRAEASPRAQGPLEPRSGPCEPPPPQRLLEEARTSNALFTLYRRASDAVAAGAPLPEALASARAEIVRATAASGGALTVHGARMIGAQLPRMLAQTVTGERASELAERTFRERHGRTASRDELLRELLTQHADSPHAALRADELTATWAAKTYCRMLLNHCTPRALLEAAGGRGADVYRNPSAEFQRAFHEAYQRYSRPFLVRSQAIARDLRAAEPGSARARRLEALLAEAEEDRFFLSGGMLSSDADLLEAARECGPEAVAVFEALTRAAPAETRPERAHWPEPHDGQRYSQELERAGQGLLYLEADARQRELGTLPVMQGVTRALLEQGLLSRSRLERVELGLRDHLTPVVEQMMRILCSQGVRHVHILGKGVSTVPLVAKAMGYQAIGMDSGIGDSRLDSTELLDRIRGQMFEWAASAAAKNHPLLIVGDGYETARAANEAARLARQASSDLRVGYVAITQSDLNYLNEAARTPHGLHMDVTSLAGTVLKDRVTSQDIADWIVEHEATWIAREKMSPLAESPVVVVGGGNIGAALVRALLARGARDVTVVDPEPERVGARLAELGCVEGVRVRARAGAAPLPPARYYFSAVGQPAVLDATTLSQMPDGAVVFNCASRGELDERFLRDARLGRTPLVSAAEEREPEHLPEHRTLVLAFRGGTRNAVRGGASVLIRRMGQPAFDGIRDKDVGTIDITFSGALAAAAVQLERLGRPQAEAPALRFLDPAWQTRVIDLAEASHGLDLSAARAALRATP